MIVCLSGRGDKDVVQVKERLEAEKEVKKMKTLQMTLSNKKNNFIPYIMAGDHEKRLRRS